MYKILRMLKDPLAKETALASFVQVLVILTSFATNAILARVLKPHGLGDYQLLLAWIAVASVFSLPGMNVVVLKSVLKNYDRFYWLALRKSLLFSSAGTILVALIAGGLYLYKGEQWTTIVFFLLVAVSIPMSGLQNYDSALIGKRDFRASRLLSLLGAIMSLFFTSIVAWVTKQAEWVCAAYLLSRTIPLSTGLFIVQRKLADCPVNHKLESELLRQGWRQTGLAIYVMSAARLDRIVLGSIDPVLLSYYFVGTLIPMQIKNNAKMALNILSTHWGQKSGEENIAALRYHGAKLLTLGALSVVLMWMGLPILIPLFFGVDYSQSITLGVIYSFALFPAFWTNMIGMESQLQSDGTFNQRSQILRYTVLTLCIALLAQYGVIWIVVSHLIADYCLAFWSYFYLRNKFKTQI